MGPHTVLKFAVVVVVAAVLPVLPTGISGMQGTPQPTVTVYKSPT